MTRIVGSTSSANLSNTVGASSARFAKCFRLLQRPLPGLQVPLCTRNDGNLDVEIMLNSDKARKLFFLVEKEYATLFYSWHKFEKKTTVT